MLTSAQTRQLTVPRPTKPASDKGHDNSLQIGHTCTIDEDALIFSRKGLAGSSLIGKRVILAEQVGIIGYLKIADDGLVTAKTSTSHDVEPSKIISGFPTSDNRDWLRSTATFRRLGEMAKTIRDLEERLAGLEKKKDNF